MDFGSVGYASQCPSSTASGILSRGTICETVLTVASCGMRWYMLMLSAVPVRSPE